MTGQKNFSAVYRSLTWTAILYVLTGFHHYYGSVIYGTPWREHVVAAGGSVLCICVVLVILYRVYYRRIWLITYLLIAFITFGLLIGLFEGFYNHVLKNILYFSGLNTATWRAMFPAPAYEVPQNLVFESTGILQFFVGVVQIYFLRQVYLIKEPCHIAN